MTKLVNGQGIIISSFLSVLKESANFYNQKIEVPRGFILIPWVVVIALSSLAAKDYLKNKEGYKEIAIYFLGKTNREIL